MHRHMWSIIVWVTLIVSVTPGAPAPAAAQTPAPPPATASLSTTITSAAGQAPVRVLFVGDCHSWFLDTYFPKLAASGDPTISIKPGTAVAAGWDLEDLWGSTFFLPDLKALVAGQAKWDFGVIGIDVRATGPDEDKKVYADWVPKYDEAFKKAGAQSVLTAVWPDRIDEGTARKTTAVVDSLAAPSGAHVAPVGLAVERVRRERPGLITYVDDYHVNAPGWYLLMCVLYATLFERSPEGLKYRLDDVPADSEEALLWSLPKGWALSDEDAGYLQRVAWETVTNR
jgi:hypothetical protein